MSKQEDAPGGRAVDPGRLDRNDRKLLLDQVVSPTDRNGRPLREEIRARLSRHVQTCCCADPSIVGSIQHASLLSTVFRESLPCCRADVPCPTVELRFEELSVRADVLVGQQARATLLNYYRNGLMVRNLPAEARLPLHAKAGV